MTAISHLSPREARPDPIAVRDINTGSVIAVYNGDWEQYLIQHIGRVGYVSTFLIDAGDDTFEIVTYRYSYADKAEIVAYIGTRADRAAVTDALFPTQQAAE